MTKKKRILGRPEDHPYGAFVPLGATSLILGTFPIAKFTKKKRPILKEGEVDFSYGGKTNQLWKLLSVCFERELKTKEQIVNFLMDEKMALGDLILRCQRYDDGSSDSDLKVCDYNLGLKEVIENSSIKTIYFTSTNVRDLFRRKIGAFENIKQVLLVSPSASGLRRLNDVFVGPYKAWRKKHPDLKINEFRLAMYKKIFREGL